MNSENKNVDTRAFLEEVLSGLKQISFIKPEDIPNIELYMDQITGFMDDQLKDMKRYPDDKLLTKTMINNYSKNNLLPPSNKKKYSKEHVLTLIFIYYFKNVLSISDIASIIQPLTEKYFGKQNDFNMEKVYKEVFNMEHLETQNLLRDLGKKFNRSREIFQDFPEEDQRFLHAFSFICLLSYDVYLKKTMIEHIIDTLDGSTESGPFKDVKF